MARMRSLSSIDAEINKVEDELEKLQQKQDALTAQLLKLKQKKQE